MSYATLWDWRRLVTALYAAVRAEPDPRAGWQMWRDGRNRLFRDHPQTPLELAVGFEGLPLFDYAPELRFITGLEACSGSDLLLPAGDDGEVRAQPFARTVGLRDALGSELTLYWLLGYGGGVFLPFADATSGRETYGGGRYLLDTIKGADLGSSNGQVTLDFNFAYNPSCAYSARYICPLAPALNRLPRPVPAGEKVPSSTVNDTSFAA